MNLQESLERIQAIRHAPTPDAYVRQRMAEAAESLSLAGIEQMHVENCNEALRKVVVLLYHRDTDHYLPHLDNVSHRIIVPMPWASIGWQKWALRQWEGDVLRMCLLARQAQPNPPRPALFYYASESRRWHLDIDSYANLALAQRYLEREPIRLPDWRRHHALWRENRQAENIANRQRRQPKGN